MRPLQLRGSTVLLALAALAVTTVGGFALYTAVASRRAEAAFPPGGRFVAVEGVRLHYRDAGRGTPVVLLHGNPGFLQDFAPGDSTGLFAALAREGRAIAVDRPGHGYSERPSAAGTTPWDQARLLHRALGQLGVERPVLVGHSWGGALALLYALKYPGDVRGLVLVAARAYPQPGRPDPVYALNRVPVVGALLRHTLMLPAGRPLVDRRLAAAYAPDAVRHDHGAAARALWLRPVQVAATVWDTRNLQRALEAVSAQYGRLAVSVVILVGDQDGGRAESLRLAPALPGAELVVVPHAGHELPLTRPEAIVSAVRRVAARAAPPARAAGPRPPRGTQE